MDKIEKAVEEFHRRSNKDYYCTNEPDDDGWNIPYEGVLIDRQEEWVKQALLTAHEQGKKDRDEEVMEWAETKDTRKACNYKGDNYSQGYYTALKMLKTFINENNE